MLEFDFRGHSSIGPSVHVSGVRFAADLQRHRGLRLSLLRCASRSLPNSSNNEKMNPRSSDFESGAEQFVAPDPPNDAGDGNIILSGAGSVSASVVKAGRGQARSSRSGQCKTLTEDNPHPAWTNKEIVHARDRVFEQLTFRWLISRYASSAARHKDCSLASSLQLTVCHLPPSTKLTNHTHLILSTFCQNEAHHRRRRSGSHLGLCRRLLPGARRPSEPRPLRSARHRPRLDAAAIAHR